MAMSSIQLALYNWAKGQLLLFPSAMSVIWEYPNAPRPTLPYVALNILSLTRLVKDYISEVDINGIAKLTAMHDMVVNISCYHSYDGSNMQAIDIVDYLRLTLLKQKVTSALNAAGISLIDANSTIHYLPANIATGFEPRATVDVRFGLVTSIMDSVGLIEHLAGTGTVENGENEIIINYVADRGD